MTTPQGFTDATGTFRQTTQAFDAIPLTSFYLAAGTPLAAFADNAGASAPGLVLDNAKACGVRWNNQATQTAILASFLMPNARQPGTAVIAHILCDKSAATVGDATTFDIAAWAQVPGALTDAGTSMGGTTNALPAPSAAAKTLQHVQVTLVAANVPVPSTPPTPVTISLKPTNGTLGTDDMSVRSIYLEYTRIVNPL